MGIDEGMSLMGLAASCISVPFFIVNSRWRVSTRFSTLKNIYLCRVLIALMKLIFFLLAVLITLTCAGQPYKLTDAVMSRGVPFDHFVVHENQFYFFDNNYDVWKTDGTPEGTRKLFTQQPESPIYLRRLFLVNNKILAFAFAGPYFQTGIWRLETNGKMEFVCLASFVLSAQENELSIVQEHSLLTTDGTYEGTKFIGLTPLPSNIDPERINVGGHTYFFINHALWKYNHANHAMEMVTEFGLKAFNWFLNKVDNLIFFIQPVGDGTFRVWRSDGTGNGTFPLTDVRLNGDALISTVLDDTLYFMVSEISYDFFHVLWKTDGTLEGTQKLLEYTDSDFSTSTSLFAFDGKIFFGGFDDEHGKELWELNPSTGKTRLMHDFAPGGNSSYPRNFIQDRDRFIFTSIDPDIYFNKFWISDGTRIEELPVDASKLVSVAFDSEMLILNNSLLFPGGDYWTTDWYLYYLDLPKLVTSFNEPHQKSLSVYPNPASRSESVKICTSFIEKGECQVFASMGRFIMSIPITNSNVSLDVSGFAPGIYHAILISGGKRLVTKFMVH